MKKLSTLILVLIVCYGAKAQIGAGEKFLGGSVSFFGSNGANNVIILPDFKYAHAENRLVGVTAGLISADPNTSFVIGPNYTWVFPIKDNLFWLLSGYGNITFGDASDFTFGAFPGLGYRVHERILVALTSSGFSYSTSAEAFGLGANLSGLGVRAYLRIGK